MSENNIWTSDAVSILDLTPKFFNDSLEESGFDPDEVTWATITDKGSRPVKTKLVFIKGLG